MAAAADTLKVRCLERDPRLTLCVFSSEGQPRFATVEGRGVIERENLQEPTRRVLASTVPRGHSPAVIEAWLMRPETLVVRVEATRVWGVLRPSA